MEKYPAVDLVYNFIEPEGCDKEKAPIIFIHGITGSKETWADIPDILAKNTKRKTYVVDSRNHGDSPWTENFGIDYDAADILRLMDTIEAPSAILIGHSVGGLAGIKIALSKPDRVEKLVVEDMTVSNLSRTQASMIAFFIELANRLLQQVPAGKSKEFAVDYVIENVFKTMPKSMAEEQRKKPEYYYNVELKKTESGCYIPKLNVPVILKTLKAQNKYDTVFTGHYDKPSCFIYGSQSIVKVGSDINNILKFFSNAKFISIEASTHSIHTAFQDQFVDHVLKFLLKE